MPRQYDITPDLRVVRREDNLPGVLVSAPEYYGDGQDADLLSGAAGRVALAALQTGFPHGSRLRQRMDANGIPTVILGDSLAAYNHVASSVTAVVAGADGWHLATTTSGHGMRSLQRVNITATGNSTLDVFNAEVRYVSATQFQYYKAGGTGTAATGNALALNRNFGPGVAAQANMRLGGRLRFLANFGQGGATTAAVLANLPAALALKPALLWVVAGINDATQDIDPVLTEANLEKIVAGSVLSGVTWTVIQTVTPYSNLGALWSASRNQRILDVNKFIRALPTKYPGVIVVDAYRALIQPMDANGYGNPALYQPADSVHYTSAGAGKIAREQAAPKLSAVLPEIDLRPVSVTDNYGASAVNTDINDRAPWTTSGGTINAPIVATPTWAATTAYVAGQAVITSGRLYRCTAAGTSSAAAPTHTSGTAVDGSVTWEFIAAGAVAASPLGFITEAAGSFTAATVCNVPRSDGLGYDVLAIVRPSAASATLTIRTDATHQNSRLALFAGRSFCWAGQLSVTNAVSSQVRILELSGAAGFGGATGSWIDTIVGQNQVGKTFFDSDITEVLTIRSPDGIAPDTAPSSCSLQVRFTFDAAATQDLIVRVGVVRMLIS